MQTHTKRSTIFDEIDFRKLGMLLIAVVIVIAASYGGYRFIQNYFALKAYKDDRDVQLLKTKLAKHFILPKEEPIVATVTDVDKLKREQPFYKNAKNGDKVFIWQDKALIYRIAENKIVDFGIIVNKAALSDQSGIKETKNEVSDATPAAQIEEDK